MIRYDSINASYARDGVRDKKHFAGLTRACATFKDGLTIVTQKKQSCDNMIAELRQKIDRRRAMITQNQAKAQAAQKTLSRKPEFPQDSPPEPREGQTREEWIDATRRYHRERAERIAAIQEKKAGEDARAHAELKQAQAAIEECEQILPEYEEMLRRLLAIQAPMAEALDFLTKTESALRRARSKADNDTPRLLRKIDYAMKQMHTYLAVRI